MIADELAAALLKRLWCWLTTRHRYCHEEDLLTERIRAVRTGKRLRNRQCNRCGTLYAA